MLISQFGAQQQSNSNFYCLRNCQINEGIRRTSKLTGQKRKASEASTPCSAQTTRTPPHVVSWRFKRYTDPVPR
ncbi:unnamed protein product [Dovyalis caffra]|uniref:Uncharacterized protein n=1 Tax=Dovyalis caffra TaxID=77055 RepID=A0AAV1QS73_9ROSI|nr:unnamed protein product [Dovyalis caffra]